MRVMALFHFNFCKMPACGWGWPWAGASVPYWHISSFFSCFCFFLVHCLFEKRFIWEVRSRVRMDNFTWNISCRTCNLSRNGRKRPFLQVRQTKIQINLRSCAVWSESLLFAWRHFAWLPIQKAPSEDSDQTAQMRSLIWIFAWRTYKKVRYLSLRIISRFDYRILCYYSRSFALHEIEQVSMTTYM